MLLEKVFPVGHWRETNIVVGVENIDLMTSLPPGIVFRSQYFAERSLKIRCSVHEYYALKEIQENVNERGINILQKPSAK